MLVIIVSECRDRWGELTCAELYANECDSGGDWMAEEFRNPD